MNLSLSWDLLTIVFFGIVITYSFIIGKDESIKVIVAAYIATVAVQGIGNLLLKASGNSPELLSSLGLSTPLTLLALTKLVLFVALIIFLTVRSGLSIEYDRDSGSVFDAALTAIFGFITAGLLLSTLLTFVTDKPLLDRSIAGSPAIASIVESSDIMKLMVEYQDVWFALPALVLVVVGLLSSRRKSD